MTYIQCPLLIKVYAFSLEQKGAQWRPLLKLQCLSKTRLLLHYTKNVCLFLIAAI